VIAQVLRFAKTRKGVALLVTLALVAVGAVGAYAYYTSSGSGSGQANAGTASDAGVVIHLHASGWDGIVPGGPGSSVTFTAWNDSTSTDGAISTVSLGDVTDPDTVSAEGIACNQYLATSGVAGASDDFSMSDVDETSGGNPTIVPANTTSAVGSAVDLPATGTLTWKNNDSADQSVCAGQTLEIAFSSS
jgi:hypothetical protein